MLESLRDDIEPLMRIDPPERRSDRNAAGFLCILCRVAEYEETGAQYAIAYLSSWEKHRSGYELQDVQPLSPECGCGERRYAPSEEWVLSDDPAVPPLAAELLARAAEEGGEPGLTPMALLYHGPGEERFFLLCRGPRDENGEDTFALITLTVDAAGNPSMTTVERCLWIPWG